MFYITKRSNKVITIRARGIINKGSLKDFKSEQKDYKFGQEFQIGEKRFQTGVEITNRDNKISNWGRNYKSVQTNSTIMSKL